MPKSSSASYHPYSRQLDVHSDNKADDGLSPKKLPYKYNKMMLVSLVLKHSKVDWETVASATGKTTIQCTDTWRKVIHPSLVSNEPWSRSGPAWSSEQKIQMVNLILASVKSDWKAIAEHFPGRTKSQVTDVWRKVVLPRLKRGSTIE